MDPMEMHVAYLRERGGGDVVYSPGKGFAAWRMVSKTDVVVGDIFVVAEHRQNGVAKAMVDSIVTMAKRDGATHLHGSISVRALNRTDTMKAFLAYGMQFDRVDGDALWFVKEIG